MTKKVIQPRKRFQIEPLNQEQRDCLDIIDEHDIIFMIGPAGTGKTYIACAYAVNEILSKRKSKIIITRPIVEAGEYLGWMPGDLHSKLSGHMLPLYDGIDKCLTGMDVKSKEMVQEVMDLSPIAYLRGRNFDNAICLLDEAQNCTKAQLKLFLTRLGKHSKMIITGDASQSDLPYGQSGLLEVIEKLKDIPEIGMVNFSTSAIVRHPLVAEIVKRI